MAEESTPKESTRPKQKKVLYFLGMLIYILFSWAFLMIFLRIIGSSLGVDKIFSVLLGLCLAGSLFSSYLFGYRVFMPVGKQGWIKNKLSITAVTTFVLGLFLTLSIPAFNQARWNILEAKSNLEKLHQKCKVYWKNNGSNQECSINIVSQPEYGYTKIDRLNIEGHGTESTFTATARPRFSKIVFTIDTNGTITEVGD